MISKDAPLSCNLEDAATPFLAGQTFSRFLRESQRSSFLHFLWVFSNAILDSFAKSLFFDKFSIVWDHQLFFTIMADPQEVVRMVRMLEVEDLAFRTQLKDAVSLFDIFLAIFVSASFSLTSPLNLVLVYRVLLIPA